ncbi:MAG TPA: heme o synthase [Anaerolineales bacterium]|nr:heme o synthase [Anaerolineales bacterium]
MFDTVKKKLKLYWPLIKSLQTGLLMTTGVAGYMSARCPISSPWTMIGLILSLFLSISGSTVLNMWWDRDIDAKMGRTSKRPLATGAMTENEALRLGLILSILGVGLAVWMGALYGLIIFGGIFVDVVIYSMWLKRRTAWGIVWGGISGGMPILAGRALGLGNIDWIGITLALSVLFWIPTHIMTFSMKYFEDYKKAGVPTFPSTYGFKVTRIAIAVSSVLAAIAIGASAMGIGVTIGYIRILIVLSAGLLTLALMSVFSPTEKVNFGLFKYASLYMLGSMLLMMI